MSGEGNLNVWLKQMGLLKYHDILMSNDVNTLEDLSLLTAEDLVSMDIPLGARRRFLASIASIPSSPAYNPKTRKSSAFKLDDDMPRNVESGVVNVDRRNSAQQRRASTGRQSPEVPPWRQMDANTPPEAIIADLQRELTASRMKENYLNAELARVHNKLNQVQNELNEALKRIPSDNNNSPSKESPEKQSPSPQKPTVNTLRKSISEDTEASSGHAAGSGMEAVRKTSPTATTTTTTTFEIPNIEPYDILSKLEKENQDLEVITATASTLLSDQAKTTSNAIHDVTVAIRNRLSTQLDVDYFKRTTGRRATEATLLLTDRSNIENQDPEKGDMSVYDADKSKRRNSICKHDYNKMLKEQDEQMKLLEKTNARYCVLLERCLQAAENDDTFERMMVGEYRDNHEYKLKLKLQRLIGLIPTTSAPKNNELVELNGQEAILDSSLSASVSLGMGEDSEAKKRRYSVKRKLETLISVMDEDGDGLLSDDELRNAVQRHPELEEELRRIAVTLAFSPRNLQWGQTDNKERDRILRKELEGIASMVGTDSDGLLDIENLKQLAKHRPDLCNKLNNLGINCP